MYMSIPLFKRVFLLKNKGSNKAVFQMLSKKEDIAVSSAPPSPQVLIVEDQEETANAIAEFLSLEHFSPLIAKDVYSALEILKSKSPDIILSDIYMPGKTGIDLFTELKKNPKWSDIPFIILSGKEDEKAAHDSICLGCDHFVKKPVNPKELKALLVGKLKQVEVRKQLEHLKLEHFKKKIIHTLSHEFRTPLVSITTGTELLIEEIDNLESPQIKNLLQSILRGGLRLEKLVEDFMLIQQIELGQASDSYKEFASPVLLGEFLSQLQQKEQETYSELYPQRTFEVQVAQEHLKLKVNMFMSQLIDAFLRVIDNAYKFSSGEKRCSIKIEFDNNKLTFSIRDWGSGIPYKPEKENSILEKFTQINRDYNEQQGCGIGLSIASYFVNLHSGSFNISMPENGQGTEIRIELFHLRD